MENLTHPDDLETSADRLRIMCQPTPTVLVERMAGCEIWAKLEHQHPSGSTKDRVAARIVADGIERGRIVPGTVVVEASSGSMSISLAMACSLVGIGFVAVMPANVTAERSVMIRRLGGDVVLTDPDAGMAGALAEVDRLAAGDASVFRPRQFENHLNTDVHAWTTSSSHRRTRSATPASHRPRCRGSSTGTAGCSQPNRRTATWRSTPTKPSTRRATSSHEASPSARRAASTSRPPGTRRRARRCPHHDDLPRSHGALLLHRALHRPRWPLSHRGTHNPGP